GPSGSVFPIEIGSELAIGVIRIQPEPRSAERQASYYACFRARCRRAWARASTQGLHYAVCTVMPGSFSRPVVKDNVLYLSQAMRPNGPTSERLVGGMKAARSSECLCLPLRHYVEALT